ncbi:MAG: aminotransferase class V-fold PLP-dependent enzyme [Planctomycetota bacterium]
MASPTGFAADDFPVLGERCYWNHAAVAPLPRACAEAMAASAALASRECFADSDRYRLVERMRASAARLIGAPSPNDVAIVPNTSTGLSVVARGLALGPGHRVVITGAEYPANRYCWTDLRTDGVDVVEVPEEPDLRIDTGRLVEAITPGTSVVALSHVQFASGFRADLPAVVEAAHRFGAVVCVDAIQSVGVIPIDVVELGIDFLVADGHKWMLGPEGVGILYAKPELASTMRPPVLGWMSVVRPTDYDAYRDGQWPKNARRFEPGSWNPAGCAGLGASLELIQAVGVDVIWSRVCELCDAAVARLEALEFACVTPRGSFGGDSGCETRGDSGGTSGGGGGIEVFDLPAGLREGFDAGELMRRLGERNVHVSARRGRLRISPHFYLPDADVDRLAGSVEEVLAEVRA